MTLGIVGAGMIVQEVLPLLADIETIQVAGIVTREASFHKLAPLAATYHIPHSYRTYGELLANPDIDTIYIANYNHLHHDYARQAIEAGKHVIIEKPMVLHASHATQLHKLAKAQQVMVIEAVNLLHLPNYHQLKTLLPQLGEIKLVSCHYAQYSSRYQRFKAGEILPAFDVTMGGGALMDINIYNLNFIVSLFGLPNRARYAANLAAGVDTSGILSLNYDGFQATALGAKDSNGPNVSHIGGELGYLSISGPINTMDTVTLHLQGQPPVVYELNHGKHRLYHEFVAFAHLIDQQDHAQVSALQTISQQVMEVVDMVRPTS